MHAFLRLLILGVCGLSPSVCLADGPQTDLLSINSVTPQQVYSGLVADTMRDLLEELLVIGLFVVGAGHVAQGRREASYYRSPTFRLRLVLLVVVVLFVTYNKLTFHVEWGLETGSVLEAAQQEFNFWQSNTAAWMVIILGPIDLMAMVCLAGMFLAVARSEYFGGAADQDDERTLAVEIRQLYFFTGATHAVFIVWWIVFRLFTGGLFTLPADALPPADAPFYFAVLAYVTAWSDVLYHTVFATAHALGRRSLNKALADAPDDIPDDSPFLIRHVGWYSFITLTVYVTRLWWYVALRYT